MVMPNKFPMTWGWLWLELLCTRVDPHKSCSSRRTYPKHVLPSMTSKPDRYSPPWFWKNSKISKKFLKNKNLKNFFSYKPNLDMYYITHLESHGTSKYVMQIADCARKKEWSKEQGGKTFFQRRRQIFFWLIRKICCVPKKDFLRKC